MAKKETEKNEPKAPGKKAEKKEKPAAKTAAKPVNTAARISDFGILLKPLLTEKSASAGSGGGSIAFRVRRDATKTEIRQAIERVFSVKVEKVRTCNYLGKMKRSMRSSGRRASFKKAYISLKEGQTLDIVEGL